MIELGLFQFRWWKKWQGFNFVPYKYDGRPGNGARVYDWQQWLGWLCITKHRIN